MNENQPSIYNKEIQITLNKISQNYLKIRNYIESTENMLLNHNKIILEYELISDEYIQKLSELSSKYAENFSKYEKNLINSDNKIKELFKIFSRIPAIFSLQIFKMKNFQKIIKESEINSSTDNLKIKQNNENFEEIKNEFEIKIQKMNQYFLNFENNNKELFDSYKYIENSLANIIICKNENKKIAINEIFMQNYQNINNKEKEFSKSKNDLINFKKKYFQSYDIFIDYSQKKFKNLLDMLTSNISTFANVFLNYFKTAYLEMEQIVKNISNNEMKIDYSQILFNLVGNIDKNIHVNKYIIKVINDNYIEDKEKIFDYKKLKKENYIIKNDKIFLKDEDIYEIVKIMYGQLQFIEEKYYNLSEEQRKLEIKNLTNKLLSFGLKKQYIFSLEEITEINDDEVEHLLNLLNESYYRFNFLKILNLFRAKGTCEMPKREFEITKKIFLYIANKIKEENDFLSSKLILILSQTFYKIENNQKIYLFKYLKNHEMLSNFQVWEKNLNEAIEDDLKRAKINKSDLNSKDNKIINIINNVLLAQILSFYHNMSEFGMKEENIKNIIDSLKNKYNINDNILAQINNFKKDEEQKDNNAINNK